MTASWDDRSNPPPDGVAQTAAHGGVPAVPHVIEASPSTPAGTAIGGGLIGRFDLRDLIIVTIGFSIGFALVRAWEEWGFVLALITLPAVGRVIYVKRRLERAGESLTWMGAAMAYGRAVIVMTVSAISAIWIGMSVGFVATLLLAIAVYLFSVAIDLPEDLASFAVATMSVVIGACAGVAAIIAVSRFFWRRWDLQLTERENRAAEAGPPADQVTQPSEAAKPVKATEPSEATATAEITASVVTAETPSSPQPPSRKQRRYDGNPRRF